MAKDAIKIVQGVLEELRNEAERGSSFGSKFTADLFRSLSKHAKEEMALNQKLHDRIAELVLPDVIPDPVAILQSEGRDGLEARLKKLSVSDLKTVAQKFRLAARNELTKLKKVQLTNLICERCESERRSLSRY